MKSQTDSMASENVHMVQFVCFTFGFFKMRNVTTFLSCCTRFLKHYQWHWDAGIVRGRRLEYSTGARRRNGRIGWAAWSSSSFRWRRGGSDVLYRLWHFSCRRFVLRLRRFRAAGDCPLQHHTFSSVRRFIARIPCGQGLLVYCVQFYTVCSSRWFCEVVK